jgi:hypothetical protein
MPLKCEGRVAGVGVGVGVGVVVGLEDGVGVGVEGVLWRPIYATLPPIARDRTANDPIPIPYRQRFRVIVDIGVRGVGEDVITVLSYGMNDYFRYPHPFPLLVIPF